jgi:NAD+ synthase (glutamine-hydrolysing)
MKIALAQINPMVGDLRHNSRKIVEFAHVAYDQGADLIVFPEMCVVGYPPQDLLENGYFLTAADRTVDWIAEHVPQDVGVIVGAPLRGVMRSGKRLRNAAILLEGGERYATVLKTLLPTYDVFDEYRYFQGAEERKIVEWRGLKLGIHICEDMWNATLNLQGTRVDHHLYEVDPIDDLVKQGADILINISASPFSLGKHERRNDLLGDVCRHHGVPFVLVNQVGANSEIVFDGDSRVHGPDGTRLLCADSFREDVLIWDMDEVAGPCARRPREIEDLYEALVLGVRDYFHKTGVFTKAVMGLSGGIDSAVTCAIAALALGPDQVVGVTMPSRYSSEGSVSDSEVLAKNLGIEFMHIPIEPAVSAFESMLEPAFEGLDADVTEENIQSRTRGVTLMALSNKFGYLLISTGNKSEVAVGYVTLYGDTNGGLALLSDVYKQQVYALAEFINEREGWEVIPRSTIDKPPSAELRPGQRDQDSLPPYDRLDTILRHYVEDLYEIDAIVDQTGYDRSEVARILRMVDLNEYKRRQAPPGIRVSMKAFGIGRRLPIVMRWNRDEVAEIARRTDDVLS